MSRFFIPGVLVCAISGLALTLIVGIIARSPYTHGNLASAAGYTRTNVSYVGQTEPFMGIGLANPSAAHTGDPAKDGGALFLEFGCASCHGLQGQGGPVGPKIQGSTPAKVLRQVRSGKKGMPAFSSDTLSDQQAQQIAAFLDSFSKQQ